MKKLYPIKFVPTPRERVWGGKKLATKYGKPFDTEKVIGESWEVVGFEQDSSIIADGFLADNSLFDVIETYMDEMVGDDLYKYFGNEFPLLIKLLDIQDRLSIQVHPDDITAFDRHNSYGKTEAWYVLEADPDARVYMGFNRDVDPNEFYQRCKDETLEEVLNVYHPHKGDFFYIEAGIIHSAGGGLVIAEVQQLSDVTYRIYDWGREHNPATARQMHLDLAFDCINYHKYDESKYYVPSDKVTPGKVLNRNPYFTVTPLDLRDTLHIYPPQYESFILYFCISGTAGIRTSGNNNDKSGAPVTGNSEELYSFSKGEWILIPASIPDFYLHSISPDPAQVLEIYVEKQEEKDNYVDDETDNK